MKKAFFKGRQKYNFFDMFHSLNLLFLLPFINTIFCILEHSIKGWQFICFYA